MQCAQAGHYGRVAKLSTDAYYANYANEDYRGRWWPNNESEITN